MRCTVAGWQQHRVLSEAPSDHQVHRCVSKRGREREGLEERAAGADIGN